MIGITSKLLYIFAVILAAVTFFFFVVGESLRKDFTNECEQRLEAQEAKGEVIPRFGLECSNDHNNYADFLGVTCMVLAFSSGLSGFWLRKQDS